MTREEMRKFLADYSLAKASRLAKLINEADEILAVVVSSAKTDRVLGDS